MLALLALIGLKKFRSFQKPDRKKRTGPVKPNCKNLEEKAMSG